MKNIRIPAAILAVIFMLTLTGCSFAGKDVEHWWEFYNDREEPDYGGASYHEPSTSQNGSGNSDSSSTDNEREPSGKPEYSEPEDFGKSNPDVHWNPPKEPQYSEPEEDLGSVIIKGEEYPIAKTLMLDLRSQGVTDEDLTEIGKLIKLTELRLPHNQITDITPLANLKNLTKLHLEHNQISDITPLAELTELTCLDLGYNYEIKDISPLANLTNLQLLNVGYNQISDLTPLEELTNLDELIIGYNQISDIMLLEGLTGLTTLELSGNPVSDLSPLANMTEMDYLFLVVCTEVHDITPLMNFKNPGRIWFWGSGISIEDEQRLKERYPACDVVG